MSEESDSSIIAVKGRVRRSLLVIIKFLDPCLDFQVYYQKLLLLKNNLAAPLRPPSAPINKAVVAVASRSDMVLPGDIKPILRSEKNRKITFRDHIMLYRFCNRAS